MPRKPRKKTSLKVDSRPLVDWLLSGGDMPKPPSERFTCELESGRRMLFVLPVEGRESFDQCFCSAAEKIGLSYDYLDGRHVFWKD